MDRTEPKNDREAPGAEGPGAPWVAPRTEALFRPGGELQRLAEDWVALRRNAFLLNQRLLEVESRLVAIEGRSTGDAHAKLDLLIQVLLHDLALAPDHRALLLARGALAALECVHRSAESLETAPGAQTPRASSARAAVGR
jgi:hypothetical protein